MLVKSLLFPLDCSSDNISPSGYVYSPRYPTVYPDDIECKQYIEVPENHSVKIEIQDFSLECCNYDILRVSNLALPSFVSSHTFSAGVWVGWGAISSLIRTRVLC